MPVSQLFEVTIGAAEVLTFKRVSKLSWKNRRRLRASGVMEPSLPRLPPVLPGPGRARGSARKVPPPARETPPHHSKLVAAGRIHESVSRGRIHLATPPHSRCAYLARCCSNDDDRSDGEGLLSGEGGGLGEAPGEFGDIADCAVGVNIDFGIEIPSSPQSSCISMTNDEANRHPFLEHV